MDLLKAAETLYQNAPNLKAATAEELNEKQITKRDTTKKPPLTLETLSDELENRGVGVSFNVITATLECSTGDLDTLIAELDSDLRQIFTGVNPARLELYIAALAKRHAVNPVLDAIQSKPWDGVERLPIVYRAMHVEDDELSMTLLRKWLMQAVTLLTNDEKNPVGADFCLTLQGDQNVGKTRFSRWLSCDMYFHEGGQISLRDKDYERRCLESWICEFGELDGVFRRADAPKLKAFITAATDKYRLAYGRHDICRARRTSLVATVNPQHFLTDETGNRRYGTIPLTDHIDFKLLDFSALLLWREVMAFTKSRDDFRLTPDELAALNERNSGFERSVPAEDEVADIIEEAKSNGVPFRPMTVSTFKDCFATLARYPVNQISAALDRIGIPQQRTMKARFRLLPDHRQTYDTLE